MTRFENLAIKLLIVLMSVYSVAQNTSSSKTSSTAKPGATTTSSNSNTLPSEATVDAFLKKMFGWNQQLTWKVGDIEPSEAPGISQATVVFSTPQGQQVTRIYVTPDQKYAFTGELVPFGADPFSATREELKEAS